LLLGEAEMLALPGSVLGAAASFDLAQRARLLMPALPVSTQPLYGRLGVNSGAFIGLVADEPPARRAWTRWIRCAPGTECSRSSVRWSGSALQVCGIVCLIGPADRRPSRQPAATFKTKQERIGCAPLRKLNALRRPRP